jgi:hypothetical protein
VVENVQWTTSNVQRRISGSFRPPVAERGLSSHNTPPEHD